MKKMITLLLLVLFVQLNAQNTYVPDDNFEQALIDLGYDTAPLNNFVPTANINMITSLDVSGKNIADLTGIQAFVALTVLNVDNNSLMTIDVTTLTALEELYCSHNNISGNIDVSNNTALITLNCGYNQLGAFDLSNNTALQYFSCYVNQLSYLNLSQNTALKRVKCQNNQLTYLNVKNGNNAAVSNANFIANNNPSLTCILVDNATYSGTNWTNIDTQTSFNDVYCAMAGMTYVPDDNFEQALIDLGYDWGVLDDQVPTANISALTILDVHNKNISDLTGIEDFSSLVELLCYTNNLSSLNISSNTTLKKLYCNSNNLNSLNVASNTALTNLSCSSNNLTGLDVSTNTALTNLSCRSNDLTSLDVSANMALTSLRCSLNTNLNSLDVSANTALEYLYCSANNLNNLNVATNTALKELDCSINNLTNIDVSVNTALTNLKCLSNSLNNLDVSTNIALTDLNCSSNNLSDLDVSANTALYQLYCNVNNLTSLNVKNGNNSNFATFYAVNNPNLTCILVDDAAYSTTNWTYVDSAATFNDVACSTQTTYVPDDNFEQALIDLGYDSGALDDYVPTVNINTLTTLNVDNKNISNLTGIEDFTALEELYLRYDLLTNIDVSNNLQLRILNIYNNSINTLDVNSNINLEEIYTTYNPLTSLDLSHNPNITNVNCINNNLTYFNIQNGNNTNITNLNFSLLGNANLTCALVDDATWSTTNWTYVTANLTFVNSQAACDALYVDATDFEDAISIYPNPARDNITITNNGSDSIDKITIYNALGTIVYQTNTAQNSIETSSFKTGVYLVQLISNKKSLTKKLIIRK